jgi:protoporphyrinogen oxidase
VEGLGEARLKNGVAILGSGMAGLGAANRLRESARSGTIFEKKRYAGGHTMSHRRDGYVFDEGPHVSFTRNERLRAMFEKAVGRDLVQVDAYIDNYWQGHWIRHPVITNMHGLPVETTTACIRDYVEAKTVSEPRIANYEDWLVASYGRAYAETFPMRYTEKYHTTGAANLSTDWVGPRLYQASLEEVLRGALAPESPNIHYVQDYRYPAHDGFIAFLAHLIGDSAIRLEHEVTGIDPRGRELRFANGVHAGYDALVSSVPLPELVPMIDGAPRDVREAAARLACTSVVLVNLGVDRPDVSRASWTYFYDAEFPFSRVSFPRTFSPHVVPEGAGSIQAEVYFSARYRPLEVPPETLIEPVIEGLRRCGTIRPGDRILFREAMLIPYANIIFDLERAAALEVVHGYLDEVGIAWCGRYGDWGYLWTDEAFESGERAAERALTRLGR